MKSRKLLQWAIAVAGCTIMPLVVGQPASAEFMLVSFGVGFTQGATDSAGNRWNQLERLCTNGCGDITASTNPIPPLSSIASLLNSTGVPTGISLAVTDPVVNNTAQNGTSVLPGFTDPSNGFVYEAGATRGYHFGRLTSGNNLGEYTIGNLSADSTYKLTILSARASATNISTNFAISHGGVSQLGSINSGQNGVGGNYTLLKSSNLLPDSNSQIKVQLNGTDANTFINFLRIDVVPEPSSLCLLGMACFVVFTARPKRAQSV